ncbi:MULTISPECIES: hypothetical protein [Providencia]|uniref:Uncharacterized protein n=1 Tax=Providencia heimbachae ATCC 35613 TaxID=1354272 RepID=A0A1B7JJC3_9GAMM|nr:MULTISPECIES: hypothetical protein [Providencia]MBP6122810.1 hypothetical protein [Providencia sp.]OAT48011.1 hypothetical protein M998_3437 [Providencia heimbachae ATCC 35613]SQH12660.1 REDY-like protein HapK [Providencia heimbachae]
MSTKTLIVFFNLKSETNEAQYLQWAKESDLPAVNKLSSISSFEVFKGISMLGQDKPSPWAYFEVIHISSEEAFLNDIQTEQMQKIINQFNAFTEDVNFILTKKILS